MRYGIPVVLLVIGVLWVLGSVDDRLRCNAKGDVRYVGDRKYVCEYNVSSGLRWTWKY